MDHPETLKPAAGSTPPGPGFFLVVRMMRPGFLVITVIGCVLGLSTAAACGCGLDPWRALGIVANGHWVPGRPLREALTA